jgi:hypothetical protein
MYLDVHYLQQLLSLIMEVYVDEKTISRKVK